MSEEKNVSQHNTKTSAMSDVLCHIKNPDVLKWIVFVLIVFVLILVAFGFGVRIGVIKATYSYRWADNYHRNFGGPADGFWGNVEQFPAGDFMGAHGVFGDVIEVKDGSVVIQTPDNKENVVVLGSDTTITKGTKTLQTLQVGDHITVIGTPNQEGQIEAKFIRVFDENSPFPLMPMMR